MKKILLILFCALTTLTAAAQSKIHWNLELGLGASAWMNDKGMDSNGLFNSKIGVGIDIPLTNFLSFQTGMSWVSKGAVVKNAYNIATTNSDRLVDMDVNQNYLQAPLLAAFHIGTGSSFDLILKGGAYFAVGVCGKTKVDIDDATLSWSTFGDSKFNGKPHEGLHRFDAGLVAGADLDFPSWYVGCDAEFGLCKIASGDAPRNFAFFVNLGYKF